MPTSPAKPWLNGSSHSHEVNVQQHRRFGRSARLAYREYAAPGCLPEPAALLNVYRLLPLVWLLLFFLLGWAATAAAMPGGPVSPGEIEADHDQSRLAELLMRQYDNEQKLARLQLADVRVRESKGQVELDFTLLQEQEQPLSLAVPLLITTPRQSFTVTLESNRAETAYHLTLPDRPTELRLDPYHELPRHLSPAETTPTWRGFMAANQRLAIVPEEVPAAWQPLLDWLAQQEITTLPLSEVKAGKMVSSALLFLGSAGQDPAGGFFAEQLAHSEPMTLQAKANPFNPELPAILLNPGPRPTEADQQLLLAKLAGGEIFSHLQITDGQLRQQKLAPAADQGLLTALEQPPEGIATQDRRGFHEIMDELRNTRVVYVGEVHDRYEDHLLQLRVLRAMHGQDPEVAVAMEMFPVSAQPALDAYLAGELDEPEFLRQAKYFTNWSFDYRLYRDIIDFARRHGLPIIALNLEPGLSGRVYREGGVSALDPEEAQQLPAERDLTLPGFRQRLEQVFTMHEHDQEKRQEQFSGFLQAQSLWDEQMAARMAAFLANHPEHRLLAVVGQGHTDKRNAIPPRLARRLPVKQAVLLPVRQPTAEAAAADYFFFLAPRELPDQARLGVHVRDSRQEDGEPAGARVAGLSPHGTARTAGVKKNDLIVAIDEWPVNNVNDLRIALLYQQVGTTVTLRLLRPETDTDNDETGPDDVPPLKPAPAKPAMMPPETDLADLAGTETIYHPVEITAEL